MYGGGERGYCRVVMLSCNCLRLVVFACVCVIFLIFRGETCANGAVTAGADVERTDLHRAVLLFTPHRKLICQHDARLR